MRFLIAGSSGFLGTLLREQLGRQGHSVTPLVRRPPGEHPPLGLDHEVRWDPYESPLGHEVVDDHDVVVNLAGTPTIGNPHSKKWARRLRESRVTTTRVLAEAIAASDTKPRFLAGNAIGYYGDHGDEVITDDSDSRGDALMTRVAARLADRGGPGRGGGRAGHLPAHQPGLRPAQRAAPPAAAAVHGRAGWSAGRRPPVRADDQRTRLGRRRHPPRVRRPRRSGDPQLRGGADQRRVHPGARRPGAPAGVLPGAGGGDPPAAGRWRTSCWAPTGSRRPRCWPAASPSATPTCGRCSPRDSLRHADLRHLPRPGDPAQRDHPERRPGRAERLAFAPVATAPPATRSTTRSREVAASRRSTRSAKTCVTIRRTTSPRAP